jgi:hypothetical protein
VFIETNATASAQAAALRRTKFPAAFARTFKRDAMRAAPSRHTAS